MFVAGRAATDARAAFGMIDCDIFLRRSREIPLEERIPGESLPVRADLQTGEEELGVLVGHLPATRTWERADQDLLELFASEIAVAIRNAAAVRPGRGPEHASCSSSTRPRTTSCAASATTSRRRSTSIRAYAHQLQRTARTGGSRSSPSSPSACRRMVRQLLTVTRLESGALHPRSEVVALAPRVRRAWEALAAADVTLTSRTRRSGWLAVADVDQLDQVLWALLDNAVKYGSGSPIAVDDRRSTSRRSASGSRSPTRDRASPRPIGPAVRAVRARPGDRRRRGQRPRAVRVARAVPGDGRRPRARADGGRTGAAFSVYLPGEPPDES